MPKLGSAWSTKRRGARGNYVSSVALRCAVALAILAIHLLAMARLGRERMGLPFNAAPGESPTFTQIDMPLVGPDTPSHWNRLLASRWDSQHYLGTTLRGNSQCPAEDLRNANLIPKLTSCAFNFYPGYSVLGWIVARVLHVAPDYALFGISLVASFLFLFLWTGKDLTSGLGTKRTYLALFFFATYTTAFALVTNQTEPCALLITLLAFISLRREHILAGALIAGVAGSLRVTGCAIGGAYALAVAWKMITSDGPRWKQVATAAVVGVVSQWGQLAILLYYFVRYKDPFLYVHAHGQAYSHGVGLPSILPDSKTILQSIASGHNEGVFIAFGLIWLALGMKKALRAFPPPERVYWYSLCALSLGIALLGSSGLAYAGMNRYWLVALPLFFSIAAVTERSVVAIVLWSALTLWHSWNVDLCVYLAQRETPQYCPLTYVP